MTVQHIVMLEFNDGVDEDTRMNSLKAVEGLKDKIDGIKKIESGKDFSGRAGDFTHAVIVTCATRTCCRLTALTRRTRRCRGFSARWSKPFG